MRKALTALAVIVALTSLAWAQTPTPPSWGEPGTFSAMTGHAGKMLIDPIFLGVLVVTLLIASRFVHWPLLPIGGAAGAAGVIISSAVTAGYSSYALGSVPFWAAAVLLGIAFGMAAVIVSGFSKG